MTNGDVDAGWMCVLVMKTQSSTATLKMLMREKDVSRSLIHGTYVFDDEPTLTSAKVTEPTR